MILAAGRGSRLAPLTDHTPKPLLPVQGKPLIHWQLAALAAAGVEACIINTHHLGEQIEASVGDGSQFGLAVSYSREAQLLESGGGIVKALPFFGAEPFVLLNGDIWTDFDFSQLTRSTAPAHARIVVTPTAGVRDHGDFDVQDNRVTQRGEGFVYCCIALLNPSIFAGYSATHFSLRDIYFDLVGRRALESLTFTGTWHDIGTLDEYHKLA